MSLIRECEYEYVYVHLCVVTCVYEKAVAQLFPIRLKSWHHDDFNPKNNISSISLKKMMKKYRIRSDHTRPDLKFCINLNSIFLRNLWHIYVFLYEKYITLRVAYKDLCFYSFRPLLKFQLVITQRSIPHFISCTIKEKPLN